MRRAFLALLACLWSAVAIAAPGPFTQLGTCSGTTTCVITTGAAAPAGSLIVVIAAVGTSNIAVTSVVDSAVNCTTYTALDNSAVASRPTVAVFYCANVALANGGTITVTIPSTDVTSATAFAIGGMSTTPADIHAKQVNGASGTTATSTSTGTLSQSYEVIVGALALNGTSSAFTPGSTFTSIGGVSNADGSAYAAYQATCSTVGQAFVPSWTTSRAYMSDIVSFKVSTNDSECASKTNAYGVLQYGVAASEAVSKANAYAVLQYGQGVSKLNAYVVLVPSRNANKLTFHSFP